MDFGSEEGEDRISGLPDHIICHILSFLPTKYAVATSILSARWKYLWTSVAILDFDARLHRELYPLLNINANQGSEITFQNFVNRVMLLNDIPHIQKFRLIYECHNSPAPICTWLHVAISRDILELELDFFLSVQKEFIRFPRKFFMSNTLVVLKLSRMPFTVPSFVCFPMLKILEIRRVMYLDDKCTQNLLLGCQVLEELVIEETTREKPRVIDISIHTLKYFSFSYKFVTDISVDCPYKFFINAPNLEYFHVKGRISDEFVVKNLETLINAHLDLRHTAVPADNYSLCHQRVCNLFKGLANTKLLMLSNDLVQLLCAVHDLNLPRFFNLTTLSLGIGVDFCWKKLVIEFIKCSPDLEVLILNNKQQGIIRDIDELRKTPPRSMPEYLLSHLKNIFIQEIYSNFLPEDVERLLHDVNILKRLNMKCQCPFRLRSQIGHTFEPYKIRYTMTEIEDVDRISSLPDVILTHILSFLQTKEAVATSLMMHLSYDSFDFSARTSEEEKVRPLKGNLVSENLKVLKLEGDSIAPWFSLSNLFLPKLLIFHLENFEFIDEDVCLDDIFWSGLPCLEEFVISYCQNLVIFCFRSSSLRRLEMRGILTRLQSPIVIIDAPSLEYLSTYDHVSYTKLKINAPSLVEAQLQFWGYRSGIELVEILKQIPSLKTLHIFTTAELLYHFAADLRAVIQLPVFPKLTCLDVSSAWLYHKHPSHLMMLVLLCEHAPNLVSLIYGDKHPSSDFKWEELSDLPPTLVPKCLSSTLKVIDIYSYRMIDDAVTKYLLQYATVLEIIRIHLKEYSMKEIDAISKLMKIPIASSVCKIVICRDL
ncbi:F-box/LRR-repeat protein At4g14096 [Beta vulgaris subsp. vulgaris]|uniref:F-box/LRR-repeat protein At4g14096 n=1 Tax=Beta vulgaris subsp. vulgaris TaxID=3555 RepID=UPI002037453A|nr:F-box/LRR-repeat protein At4g14096 [Beta vulgaris subsp. vulgaris]